MLHFCHRLFIYGFYLCFIAVSETFVTLVKAQQGSRLYSWPASWSCLVTNVPEGGGEAEDSNFPYLHSELQSSASLCLVSAGAGSDECQGVFPIKSHRERALRFRRCFQPFQQQTLQLWVAAITSCKRGAGHMWHLPPHTLQHHHFP